MASRLVPARLASRGSTDGVAYNNSSSGKLTHLRRIEEVEGALQADTCSALGFTERRTGDNEAHELHATALNVLVPGTADAAKLRFGLHGNVLRTWRSRLVGRLRAHYD
jgi:hypothetical protein